jgi:hypothetical protein
MNSICHQVLPVDTGNHQGFSIPDSLAKTHSVGNDPSRIPEMELPTKHAQLAINWET